MNSVDRQLCGSLIFFITGHNFKVDSLSAQFAEIEDRAEFYTKRIKVYPKTIPEHPNWRVHSMPIYNVNYIIQRNKHKKVRIYKFAKIILQNYS